MYNFCTYKFPVDDGSTHRYNKSLCMLVCLYGPNKISKGHFVPRDETMSYLELLFQIRGLISFSCHIPLLVLFFGETFMVNWSYNNITLFY